MESSTFIIVVVFLSLAVLATLAFFAHIMSQSVHALRDIAREALLSTKARDASELAQTSAYAHEAQELRSQGLPQPVEATPAPGSNSDRPSEVMLPDGEIVKVLRPFL